MSQRISTADQILDATSDAVRDLGVRRTTFAEVARRAGVSRMTLYRHFPDVTTCVAELMTREFGALLRHALDDAEPATARQRIVSTTVAIVDGLVDHPLFVRVLDVDPELLLPYLTDRFGGTQRAAGELCAQLIVEGQADGSVRPGDPRLLADCLVLALEAFVVSTRVIRERHAAAAVRAELEHLVSAFLAPAPFAADREDQPS